MKILHILKGMDIGGIESFIINKNRNIDDIINYIRVNNNSLSRKYNKNKYHDLIYVNNECMKYYPNDLCIMKVLNYIRIKNCLSCLKDAKKYKSQIKDFDSYIQMVYKTDVGKFRALNTFKTTIISIAWRIIPIKIMIKVV